MVCVLNKRQRIVLSEISGLYLGSLHISKRNEIFPDSYRLVQYVKSDERIKCQGEDRFLLIQYDLSLTF